MPHRLVGGPAPPAARVGRDLQRYDEAGRRLVAGCIPVRYADGAAPSPDTVSILLVTSRSGKGLVLPKGGWERDESVADAAAREALEEAGVRGVLQPAPLGPFALPAKPGKPESGGAATMFALDVKEELPSWPESAQRARVWLPLAVAASAPRHAWMRDAVAAWAGRQGWAVEATAEGEQAAAAAAAAAVAAAARGAGAVPATT